MRKRKKYKSTIIFTHLGRGVSLKGICEEVVTNATEVQSWTDIAPTVTHTVYLCTLVPCPPTRYSSFFLFL